MPSQVATHLSPPFQAGILPTVFEQDSGPDARPRDWSFGIYWAQSRIDECLTDELKALVDTAQTDPSYRRNPDSVLPLYHGTTGELLKTLPAPDAIRLKRKAWLGLLRTRVEVRVSHLPIYLYPIFLLKHDLTTRPAVEQKAQRHRHNRGQCDCQILRWDHRNRHAPYRLRRSP